MRSPNLKLLWIALIISFPAWFYLFWTDWKLAIVLIAIITGNNLGENNK